MSQDADPMTDDDNRTDTGSSRFVDDPETARRYLLWIAVGLLAVLAIVATVRVYTSASAAISRFVAFEYRALFQAAFNLAVLLLAVAGITRLLRELRAAT